MQHFEKFVKATQEQWQGLLKDPVGELPKVGDKFHFRTAFAALVEGKTPHKACFYGRHPAKTRFANSIFKKTLDPLLDRIGIHVEVPKVDYEKLSSNRLGESVCGDPRMKPGRV